MFNDILDIFKHNDKKNFYQYFPQNRIVVSPPPTTAEQNKNSVILNKYNFFYAQYLK